MCISASHIPSRQNCNAVQPRRNRWHVDELVSLPHQDEKNSLEGVLGIGTVRQSPTADVPDHRTVPANELGKIRFDTTRKETNEQIAIRAVIDSCSELADELSGDASHTDIMSRTG